MRGKHLFVGSIAALGMSSISHGQVFSRGLFDVAFGDGNPAPSGPAYWGGAGDQWNEIDVNGGYGSLFDTNGNLTSTVMVVSGACYGEESTIKGTQPDPALTNYYLSSLTSYNGLGFSIWLVLLIPNQKYNIVFYLASDDAVGGNRAVAGNINNINFSASGDPAATFINGTNIAVTSFVTDKFGFASIQFYPQSSSEREIDLNGFQFQAVPEPAPIAALGLGVLGCLVRRRKR